VDCEAHLAFYLEAAMILELIFLFSCADYSTILLLLKTEAEGH